MFVENEEYLEKINVLLKGRRLLCEISTETEQERTWLEICVSEDIPAYPLRMQPNAMLKNSKYLPSAGLDGAKFKMRRASFPAVDIEMGFDPPYDKVGEYQIFNNFDELMENLIIMNVNFLDFTDAQADDEYPL